MGQLITAAYEKAKTMGLPFIMNTHTGEVEHFPALKDALREAKVRDEDIFKATDAPSLVECAHWLAYHARGVLMLDDVHAWKYFHPDRPLFPEDTGERR